MEGGCRYGAEIREAGWAHVEEAGMAQGCLPWGLALGKAGRGHMSGMQGMVSVTVTPLWWLQVPSPGELHSPEQRSFRERQKYFEIEVKQQQVEKPPKRVSLVGEDDLKKMKEEEGAMESRLWGWGVAPLGLGSFLQLLEGSRNLTPTPDILHPSKGQQCW